MVIFKYFAIMRSSTGRIWVSNPFDTEAEASDFGFNHKSQLLKVQRATFDLPNKLVDGTGGIEDVTEA